VLADWGGGAGCENIEGMEGCGVERCCWGCENCAMISALPMDGALEAPFDEEPSEIPPPSPKLPSPMFSPRRSSSRALPALGGGAGAD
jgi:hypothetical protein